MILLCQLIELHNDQDVTFKQSYELWHELSFSFHCLYLLDVVAYLFMRTSKKDTETAEEEEESKVAVAPPTSSSVPSTASMVDKSPSTTPVVQPVIKREPIPPSQQHELFKWMLEEKRKIKPKDAEERKRIDEEKAILKQFLRVKSLPNL